MVAPAITNLASFRRSIDLQKKKVRDTATVRYRKFVTAILTDLAKHTPQWSGDLAASWQVVVGKGSSPDARNLFIKSTPIERPAPHFLGDMPAVKVALHLNAAAINSIRWNNVVSVVNTNPTVQAIESQIDLSGVNGWLRPGNYIPGDIMAVSYVANKYANRRGNSDINLGTEG